MNIAHRRYIAIEAAIAAAINGVLSVAFFFLIFGRADTIPVAGMQGLVGDSLPQSFMVAAMSTLVPTLIARRRVARGAIARLPFRSRLPRRVAVRTLTIGFAVAALAGAGHALLLPMTGTVWSFWTALAFKTIYGAALGAIVASFAVRAALADG